MQWEKKTSKQGNLLLVSFPEHSHLLWFDFFHQQATIEQPISCRLLDFIPLQIKMHTLIWKKEAVAVVTYNIKWCWALP